MGVSAQEYRIRTGRFMLVYRQRNHVKRCGKYSPYCRGTDVHIRSAVTGCLLTFIVLASCCFVRGSQSMVEMLAGPSAGDPCWERQPTIQSVTTSPDPLCGLYGVQYIPYLRLQLQLAGDVESNPGPSGDTQMILDAISDSSKKLAAEIEVVRDDLKCVREDMVAVKSEIGSIKAKVKAIDKKQTAIDETINNFGGRFDRLENDRDYMMSEFEAISMRCDRDFDRMEAFERQINALEAENLKCSMRIFGLPEIESESKPLKTVIDEKVFSSTDPSDDVNSGCLTSVQRIGRVVKANPRMVLVNFESHGDKLKLFKYRQVLRNTGIRIANDLSYNQRRQIREANQQGFYAYFKNGVLHRQPKIDPAASEGNSNRVRRRGVRTLDDRNREYLQRQSNRGYGEDHMETTDAFDDTTPTSRDRV